MFIGFVNIACLQLCKQMALPLINGTNLNIPIALQETN